MKSKGSIYFGYLIKLNKEALSKGIVRPFEVTNNGQHQICRNLSSLGNPMFPQKQVNLTDEELNGIVSKENGDFFSNHGGKLFAGLGFLLIYWLFSLYKEGKNKDEAELNVITAQKLEPNEINLLKSTNKINSTICNDIILQFDDLFDKLTYSDFINKLNKNIPTINNGHLLDRVIIDIITNNNTNNNSPIDTKLPIHLLLVSILLATQSFADDKIDILFDIALKMENKIINNDDNNNLDNYQISNDKTIDTETVQILIEDLILTFQVTFMYIHMYAAIN
jgi:hypothetical protein